MRKYALIKNSMVVQTVELEDCAVLEAVANNEMVIDITDQVPQPAVGYVLNGNKLEIPQNISSREQFEIDLNSRKAEFGTKISKSAVNRIGARNKILNKSGAQVTSLLVQLLNVKALLETGALGTARYACTQLREVYMEYADIFNEVINQINDFETNFGL